MPSLDMGGKCIAGVEVLVKVAMDRKGCPVGANATGKFGTPKCEFILQLLRVNEPENENLDCWVGANPKIGERAVAALLSSGGLDMALGVSVVKVEREVSKPAGCDMRCDFLFTGADDSRTVLEVKTVVDSDYNPDTPPSRLECVFFGRSPYVRAGIFPWGKGRQAGPDGEKVVSARAIKHIDELTALARGERTEDGGARLGAAVLFVVVRKDVSTFRPNAEACPSFASHLRDARAAGVRVLARRIAFSDSGDAFDDGEIPVDLS